MGAIVRAFTIYIVLMVMFRLAGKRTLAQTTPFEFVLLLIISETVQQAMVGRDQSLTNGILMPLTLISIAISLSLLKQWSPRLDRWMDGLPVILIESGRMHRDRMDKVRVDEEDILESARELQASERLDQIEFAVLERGGTLTIIPKQQHQEQNQGGAQKPARARGQHASSNNRVERRAKCRSGK